MTSGTILLVLGIALTRHVKTLVNARIPAKNELLEDSHIKIQPLPCR